MSRPVMLGVAAWAVHYPLTLAMFALVDAASPQQLVVSSGGLA